MGKHDFCFASLERKHLPKPLQPGAIIEWPSKMTAAGTSIQEDKPPTIQDDRMLITTSALFCLVNRLLRSGGRMSVPEFLITDRNSSGRFAAAETFPVMVTRSLTHKRHVAHLFAKAIKLAR